jgi:type IV secretory pathway VirB2 component (pilin)
MLAMPASPGAHVGSPDVFVEVSAGPYRAYVTVRPPVVIPGVADIEVLVASGDASEVRIVPTPLAGDAARFAPTPDRADPAPDDPQRYTGRLWMMSAGAWQVRVTIDGALGSGTAVVPVPTLPQATRGMNVGLQVLLALLMVILAAGAVAIVSAMAREGSLGAGEAADPLRRRRGHIAGAIATLAVVIVIALGNWWWSAEAGAYARYVYRPLTATTSVDDGRLTMALSDPGWIATRLLDDLVEDHGRLMHLFVVSPALDRLWHLHPGRKQPAVFEQALPAMPKGDYEFFADVVHATGLAETITGRFTLDEDLVGAPLTGDDSGWSGAPTPRSGPLARVSNIADGARIVWVTDDARPIVPRQLTRFTFRVEDAAGSVLDDLDLYMGMPGHAVFLRRDRGVFAHVHPGGSAAMAATAIGEQSIRTGALIDHGAHGASGGTERASPPDGSGVPGIISFPYGLPGPGDYRVFVQIKRSGRVETGAFDVLIDDALSGPAGR